MDCRGDRYKRKPNRSGQPRIDSNEYSNFYQYTDDDPNGHAYEHPYTNSYSNVDTDAHANLYTYPNSYVVTDADVHANSHSFVDTD